MKNVDQTPTTNAPPTNLSQNPLQLINQAYSLPNLRHLLELLKSKILIPLKTDKHLCQNN